VYQHFYGLRELPFELTPNPRFLFATLRHREALSNLKFGLSTCKPLRHAEYLPESHSAPGQSAPPAPSEQYGETQPSRVRPEATFLPLRALMAVRRTIK
jgi:hypothetical protein